MLEHPIPSTESCGNWSAARRVPAADEGVLRCVAVLLLDNLKRSAAITFRTSCHARAVQDAALPGRSLRQAAPTVARLACVATWQSSSTDESRKPYFNIKKGMRAPPQSARAGRACGTACTKTTCAASSTLTIPQAAPPSRCAAVSSPFRLRCADAPSLPPLAVSAANRPELARHPDRLWQREFIDDSPPVA